jgi:acetyl esterase/lipase
MMKWFWQAYAPESKQRQEAYASPLRAGAEKLRGLPPTLIQTAELDVLRDEGGNPMGANWTTRACRLPLPATMA